MISQKEWYQQQGISYEFMHTCTACGAQEVSIHMCTDETYNKHVNLCSNCHNEYLGKIPLTKKVAILFKSKQKDKK